MNAAELKIYYDHARSVAEEFMDDFNEFSKKCDCFGILQTCNHTNNDYLISIIGGSAPCKPTNCPFLRKEIV